jgi:hypothetical protein
LVGGRTRSRGASVDFCWRAGREIVHRHGPLGGERQQGKGQLGNGGERGAHFRLFTKYGPCAPQIGKAPTQGTWRAPAKIWPETHHGALLDDWITEA